MMFLVGTRNINRSRSAGLTTVAKKTQKEKSRSSIVRVAAQNEGNDDANKVGGDCTAPSIVAMAMRHSHISLNLEEMTAKYGK